MSQVLKAIMMIVEILAGTNSVLGNRVPCDLSQDPMCQPSIVTSRSIEEQVRKDRVELLKSKCLAVSEREGVFVEVRTVVESQSTKQMVSGYEKLDSIEVRLHMIHERIVGRYRVDSSTRMP